MIGSDPLSQNCTSCQRPPASGLGLTMSYLEAFEPARANPTGEFNPYTQQL